MSLSENSKQQLHQFMIPSRFIRKNEVGYRDIIYFGAKSMIQR